MSAECDASDLAAVVDQAIAKKPDVIIAWESVAQVIRARTKSIPIVLVGSLDPVRAGLAQSLARPGLNVTGLTQLNEQLPGSVVRPAVGSMVRVQAAARSWTAFGPLEIVCNGEVVKSASLAGALAAAALELELPVNETCWLAARCTGPGPFAHTSPVYIDVPGKPFARHQPTVRRFTEELDRMIAWREKQAGCLPDRDRLVGVLRQAQSVIE